MANISHTWSFFNAGGSRQIRIKSGEDIRNLSKLDKKLFAVLSCPVDSLYFDKKTLSFLDSDSDSQIRRDEVVKAASWTCSLLKNCDTLLHSSDNLILSNINDSNPEGALLLSAAKEILKDLGKADSDKISVDDFADTTKIFANSKFNADGIVTLASADDDSTKDAISAILTSCVPSKDRSGADGITKTDADNFFALADKYVAWKNEFASNPAIMPLGDSTVSAYALFKKLEDKIEDYWNRAELVDFDSSAEVSVNPSVDVISSIMTKPASESASLLEALPIAKIRGGDTLNLEEGINPKWKSTLANFAKNVCAPILKLDSCKSITKSQWNTIKETFAPYSAWVALDIFVPLSKISPEKITELASNGSREKIADLFVKEDSLKGEIDNITNLEKLVLYHKNLCEFLRNFVNFEDFYSSSKKAIFQYGKLYFDRRVCDLCMIVNNMAKSTTLAPMSYAYLLYCTCRRKGEKDISIVAAVTAGDDDNMLVGRNGIFYDRQGRDWDATVTKIVTNPIGIRQAFWSPYKRCIKWIGEQIAKRASAADSSALDKMKTLPASDTKASATPPKKIDIGTVAALGVAVSGLTAAFGMILGFLFKMGWWLPLGIVGGILSISLPSMIIAAMKLRNRNLAPLLDSNGWAVNSQGKISMVFGSHLTRLAALPKDSEVCGISAKKVLKWILLVLILALLAGGAYCGWKCKNNVTACEENQPVCKKIETPVINDKTSVKNSQDSVVKQENTSAKK